MIEPALTKLLDLRSPGFNVLSIEIGVSLGCDGRFVLERSGLVLWQAVKQGTLLRRPAGEFLPGVGPV
jgi:hypothetical protein